MLSDIYNVLVIRLSSLGDVVLTTPVYRNLKSAWPSAHISVLVKPAFAPVLRGHPDIDEIIEYDGFFSSLRKIRKRRFSHLLDLHSTPRSVLLSFSSGIPNRLRYQKAALARRLFVQARRRSPDLERHTVDRYLESMAPWGVPVHERIPKLFPQSLGSSVSGLDDFSGTGDLKTLIGIHPGSLWPTKRWPAHRYAELAHRFGRDPGTRIVLLGGPADADLCKEIQATAGLPSCLNLAGRLALNDFVAVLERLSLFITNDSGPMHIAAAVGVPTLAVFGPTTRELGFFPREGNSRVVEADLRCRPCSIHGGTDCPQGHFLCMELITVGQVEATAKEMLNKPSAISGQPSGTTKLQAER